MKHYITNRGMFSIDNGSAGATTLFVSSSAQFTGSVGMTGSVGVTGSFSVSGSMNLTGSINLTGSLGINGVTVKDVKAPKITVGNSTMGDTINDCDYLDVGNGLQLQAALNAASANLYDVWLRPGTIQLVSGPINIPTLVTLRCSGFASPIRPSSTDRRAVIVAASAKAYDLYVEVTTPANGCTGTTLIQYSTESQLFAPFVYPLYSTTLANMSNESLLHCISGSSANGAIIENAVVGMRSYEQVGILTKSMTALGCVTFANSTPAYISNFRTQGVDNGMSINGYAVVTNCSLTAIHRTGMILGSISGDQKSPNVDNVFITTSGSFEQTYGVTVDTGGNASGLFGAKINNVSVTRLGAVNTGSIGIRAIGTGVGTQIVNCSVDGFATAVTASATQTSMVVSNNVSRGHTNGFLVQSSNSLNTNNVLV